MAFSSVPPTLLDELLDVFLPQAMASFKNVVKENGAAVL